jgi:prophage regulatory protein
VKRILRLPEVVEVTGKKRSTIYADVKAGRFPRPVPLGARARGWLAEEIEQWIRERAALRSAGVAQ